MFNKQYRDNKLEKVLNKIERLPNGLFPRTTKWKLEYDKSCLLGVDIRVGTLFPKEHKIFLYQKNDFYYLFYLDIKSSTFIKTIIEDIDEFLKKYPIYEYEETNERLVKEVSKTFDTSIRNGTNRVLVIYDNKPIVFVSLNEER